MKVYPTSIPDVKKIIHLRHQDKRGVFSELFVKREFQTQNLPAEFLQDNHSFSSAKHTLRGLHYQADPFAQDKLISVLQGAILDVAVDLRKTSPSFGKYVGLILNAEEPVQIFVPAGFAHGFCTLEPHTHVLYKVSREYSPSHERGIRWNDPDLNIDWSVSPQDVILSEKDATLPLFKDVRNFF
jgi:dTDP-4-dehydrorhamnose 3,5-epimerase